MTDYIIISPVRNEAKNIEATLQSVIRQTRKPLVWVLVDDGSTDRTAELVSEYVEHYPWIRLLRLADRGYYDLMEAGELKAFLHGMASVQGIAYEYLAKLDGDISFDENYYEQLLQHFEKNPKLGIASGTCWHEENGHQVVEENYPQHVRGAMRVYRKACLEDIGGFVIALGWDAIDCYKARMRGWVTRSFEELPVRHSVQTWTKGGLLHGCQRSGRMEYLIGTHPVFFWAKCLRKLCARPFLLAAGALAYGYLAAWINHEKHIGSPDLVTYIHREQMSRIFPHIAGRRQS